MTNGRACYLIFIAAITITMMVEIYNKQNLIFSYEILQPLLCLFYSCLLVVIVYNWIIISNNAARVAQQNGRKYKRWLWLSLLTLPPIIFAIVVMLPPVNNED